MALPTWRGSARHGSSTRGAWCSSSSRRAGRNGPTSRSGTEAVETQSAGSGDGIHHSGWSTSSSTACARRRGRSIVAVTKPIFDENARAERLLDAQDKAAQLFDEIERRAMIRAGIGEQQLSDEINALAATMFGVTRHWHRRIVRAGENTLQPFKEHPPDRVIADGDIVFLDFGPIFEEWEADFGRTFVLGDDPVKLRLRDDLPVMFDAGRRFFEE